MIYQHICRSIRQSNILCTPTQCEQIAKYARGFAQKGGPKLSEQDLKKRTTINYLISGVVAAAGMTFAAVPLYRIFCQASGYGGTIQNSKFT